ncbi:MAG: wax ester/triacylglycerol synthase family O-acyltransferase [Pseudomonadales bacterium]|uniref:WS/DGAT/MGAT family O-acyltransferase n=1 Tax=unclassified Ketobacter TaxID=2639109 RepID=UPI000C6B5D2B|nr:MULTISPECIES: wax ester/triacylglycerol synthase family O-acyltransferase [unclassified Ketobacter]MAA61012.1 wax ester/triacylglycerol synthase family O-acyltransferase [Pseudomonadales bacterium]TNC90476.1 MAG: wax ester/triacylglycerol synthase family O-acyltransferase [Alcanivorax sp.]HAG93038.1 wax ester/triacylglycerol synthase family O-acyltransferase [Gammaproteobacteria bacterium]MAQ26623.1 wax ester/triacylglycerol synthase family O-acyltransferase [Pseudomonadales bacterium]MBI26
MKPLSATDNLFLMLEKRQQPTHIAGLQLFDFPEDAPNNFVTQFAEALRAYNQPVAPFNQRLHYRFGRPYWKHDGQFDLEHHFRHVALPKPGRIRELLALVSAEHSNLMDRERPLWECCLIEGLKGRRFAVYGKQHHAIMDGMSAMRLGTKMLSNDPAERDMAPVWAFDLQSRSNHRITNRFDATTVIASARAGIRANLAAIPHVARALQDSWYKSKTDVDYTSIFQAPQCVLNERITGSRRFAAESYSLARIQRIAKAFDATINDVVLAICGSALRDYLSEQSALPQQPLIAAIPVSLRQDDSIGGNEIVTILANLGTHVADAAQRMSIVKASVQEAKQRLGSMTRQEIMAYTALMLTPAGMQMLTGMMPRWQAFNVLISNVPGPKEPLYWNGARLRGMYPVSMPLDRLALNITILSYYDQLEFGLTACRRTLPSMQRMLAHLETGIEGLEAAAGLNSLRRNERQLA